MRFSTLSAILLAVSLVAGCQDQKPKDQMPTAVQSPDSGLNEASTPLPEPGPMTYTPPPPPLADTAAPMGSGSYVVKPGDTLYKIAREQLGDPKRYKEIKALNPEIPESYMIKAGQVLKLPKK